MQRPRASHRALILGLALASASVLTETQVPPPERIAWEDPPADTQSEGSGQVDPCPYGVACLYYELTLVS